MNEIQRSAISSQGNIGPNASIQHDAMNKEIFFFSFFLFSSFLLGQVIPN